MTSNKWEEMQLLGLSWVLPAGRFSISAFKAHSILSRAPHPINASHRNFNVSINGTKQLKPRRV